MFDLLKTLVEAGQTIKERRHTREAMFYAILDPDNAVVLTPEGLIRGSNWQDDKALALALINLGERMLHNPGKEN